MGKRPATPVVRGVRFGGVDQFVGPVWRFGVLVGFLVWPVVGSHLGGLVWVLSVLDLVYFDGLGFGRFWVWPFLGLLWVWSISGYAPNSKVGHLWIPLCSRAKRVQSSVGTCCLEVLHQVEIHVFAPFLRGKPKGSHTGYRVTLKTITKKEPRLESDVPF